MDPGLAPLAAALAAVRAVDAATVADLGGFVVAMCRLLDGFEAERARFVAEVERSGAWAAQGAVSPEQWLAQATGSSTSTAAARTRLASTLAAAPSLADAVGEGRVSPDTARVLADAVGTSAFAAEGDRLVEAVDGLRPAQAVHARDRWLAAADPHALERRTAAQFERRSATFTDGDDGLDLLQVRLPPLPMRVVRNALDHLVEGQHGDGTGRSRAQRRADALVELCDAYAKGTVTGGRGAPTMLVSVSYPTLFEGGNEPGRLATGETVTAEEVRRLAEQANLHRVILGPASEVLDFGRARRLASESQYRALVVRDGGCRWPGCDRPPGWCEIDHLDDWTPNHGRTDLDRLVLFCSRHHHQRHQPGYAVAGTWRHLTITLPNGVALESVIEPILDTTTESVPDRPDAPLDGASVAGAAPGATRPVATDARAAARRQAEQVGRELVLALSESGP